MASGQQSLQCWIPGHLSWLESQALVGLAWVMSHVTPVLRVGMIPGSRPTTPLARRVWATSGMLTIPREQAWPCLRLAVAGVSWALPVLCRKGGTGIPSPLWVGWKPLLWGPWGAGNPARPSSQACSLCLSCSEPGSPLGGGGALDHGDPSEAPWDQCGGQPSQSSWLQRWASLSSPGRKGRGQGASKSGHR